MSPGFFDTAAEPSAPEAFARPFLALDAAKASQVMRREVSPAELAVFVALASHDRGDRVVWPGVPLLARLTEVTARRVRGALRGLVGRGWIEAVGVTPGGVIRYRLLGAAAPLTSASPPTDADVLNPLTSASAKEDASVTQKGTGKKGPRKKGSPSEPEGFVEFWSQWPRKDDKKGARRAWKTATKKARPAEIMAGLARQLPEFARRPSRRLIPLPTSWLNGERWEDEMGATPLAKPLVFET